MRSIIICTSILLFISIESKVFPYRAFCHVPVADLFTSIPNIPGLGQPWDVKSMPSLYSRSSQLLFNEQVLVTEERDNYSHVNIFHWFYIPSGHTTPSTDYWILSSTLTSLDDSVPKSQPYIPKPISFKTGQMYYENVVTLTYPYTHNNITYSAGTRFVKSHTYHSLHAINVCIYNPLTHTPQIISIPQQYLQHTELYSSESKRALFLSLLEQWLEDKNSCFPYVLGGASIVERHPHNEVITTKLFPVNGVKKAHYYRPLYTQTLPTGIDCSHLLARAAQIAQIPIFARNTTTLLALHKPISHTYKLKNGDLIVWKGHCCIIADIKKNLVIEARGLGAGYGKIQKISLASLFKNVRTYRELLKKYHCYEPLIRIDIAGEIVQQIENFAIIPLIQDKFTV